MSITSKAHQTARLIGTVKAALAGFNVTMSVVLVIGGVNLSKPDYSALEFEGSPFATPMVIGGLVSLVFGTAVIWAVGGFFQYMLATNAELLDRLTYADTEANH